MHTRISAALAALLIGGLASQVSAQEYCVTCTGPDAKYRCIIGGDAGAAAGASRGQLLCITQLAQSGHHESCSVGRRQAEPCEGELKTVMFPSDPNALPPPLAAPQPGAPKAQPPSQTVNAGQAPPAEAPTPAQTPQTVEQLAKKTAEASGEGLKKAGEAVSDTAKSTGHAIGNAVSKTWKCMTSLFSDC